MPWEPAKFATTNERATGKTVRDSGFISPRASRLARLGPDDKRGPSQGLRLAKLRSSLRDFEHHQGNDAERQYRGDNPKEGPPAFHPPILWWNALGRCKASCHPGKLGLQRN